MALGLNILVPVTRDWTAPYVIAKLAESDIPREAHVHLVLDAPGCENWIELTRRVFPNTKVFATGNDRSLDDWEEGWSQEGRRERHIWMRSYTQRILPDYGLLLALEDDTIVPPDVFSRLLKALRRIHATAVSGVQVSRHGGLRAFGVWKIEGHAWRTLIPSQKRRIQSVDAFGHYCMLTQTAFYKNIPLTPGPPPLDAVDRAHTYRIGNLGSLYVDWDCGCGHMLTPFYTIPPEAKHVVEYHEGREPVVKEVRRIQLPNGRVFFETVPDEVPQSLDGLVIEKGNQTIGDLHGKKAQNGWWELEEAVVINGTVAYPKGKVIPMEEAVRLGVVPRPRNLKPAPLEDKQAEAPAEDKQRPRKRMEE